MDVFMPTEPVPIGPHLSLEPDNRAALIVIVTAIGLCWMLLTLIIRTTSRLYAKSKFGLEEALVTTASAFAAVSSICIFLAIGQGLGQKDSDFEDRYHRTGLKLLYAADLFYPVSLSIAKGAILPLLVNLTRIRKFVLACHLLAVAVALWGIISVALVASRCHLDHPWKDLSSQTCPSLYNRWVVIETFSLLIEAFLFAIFASIIYILRMSRTLKIKVILAFSVRLPIAVPTVFRLIYLRQGLDATGNVAFALTNAIIATQVVLHCTTMAASLAYLKPFLRAFDSNLGATIKLDAIEGNGRTHDNSFDGTSNGDEEKDNNYGLSNATRSLNHKSKPSSRVHTSNRHLSHIFEEQQTNPRSSRLLQGPEHDIGNQTRSDRCTSRESARPMITKTQEWHIDVEENNGRPRGVDTFCVQ